MNAPRAVWGSYAALLAASLLVAGCAGGDGTGGSGGGGGAGAAQPTPAPHIAVNPPNGLSGVRLDSPVQVALDHGQLQAVTLGDRTGTRAVSGDFSPDHRMWTAAQPLDPSTTYVVRAQAQDAGVPAAVQSVFTTLPVGSRLRATVTPDSGATVGSGMPVTVTFNAPIPADRRQSVLDHIQVQSTPPVVGAWRWYSATTVHWRPRDLWPAHTAVTVTAALKGVDAGHGVWGLADWTTSFTTGDKHVSVIDTASHQMQVYDNDQLIHTYPVSTGRPSLPTIGGTLVVPYKLPQVRMTSTSIGIPVNSPDGYDEVVHWDVAISVDGYFIHSAPWSVWAQGSQNVSHGCVNLSPERAQEFYQFSQVGDVVQVVNSPLAATAADGMDDWLIPFDRYANSAPAPSTPAAATPAGGGI